MELKGKVISFLGDSITEGCGTSGVEKHFVTLIGKRCGFKRFNNYGIGGTRIAPQHTPSATARWDLDFCGRCKNMDPESDIIVVFGGTNDFGHGDAPIGDFEDRGTDTFCGSCHYLMRTLIETYTEAVIVICTPLHRGGENNRQPVTMAEYNAIIKRTAEYYSLPVLDLWSISGMQPAVEVIKSKYMPDGLHPNDAGHELLAARITGFLQAL